MPLSVKDGKVVRVEGDYFSPISKRDIGSLEERDFEGAVPMHGETNEYLPDKYSQYPTCYRKIKSSNKGKRETVWVREDVFISSWDDNMDYEADEDAQWRSNEWLKSQIRTAKEFTSSPNNKILSGELYCESDLLDALIGTEGKSPETLKNVSVRGMLREL